MYKNLLAEMTRNNIKKQDVAEALNISLSTVWAKFNGQSMFTLGDAATIQRKFFPNLTIEYLFSELFETPHEDRGLSDGY